MKHTDEASPVQGEVSWHKDCECKGMSSTGQFRSKETGRGKGYINIAMHYYHDPSCDVCGKPWVRANAALSGWPGKDETEAEK